MSLRLQGNSGLKRRGLFEGKCPSRFRPSQISGGVGVGVLLLHLSIPNQPGSNCLGSLHTLSNVRMAEPQFWTLLLDTGSQDGHLWGGRATG